MENENLEDKIEETIVVEQTEVVEKEINWQNEYIRLLADFENYKKRVNKEKEEIRESVKTNTLQSILDIDSDINIAINTVQDEKTKEGLNLIGLKITNFLKNNGIESVDTKVYDADIHEVIHVVETGEENKILSVVSKGYKLNEKIIRYPKIILSK